MLSDIELFIVTWILSAIVIASLAFHDYASNMLLKYRGIVQISDVALSKLRWSEKRAADIRSVSAVLFILSAILGQVIGFANYLPITEQNPETIWFRTFSIPPLFFFGMLLIYGARVYMVHKVLRADLTGEEININI